jgi:hypothetical protein
MKTRTSLALCALTLSLLAITACAEQERPSGDVVFDFDGWAGPLVPVNMYVPEGATAMTPIVIVLHGASRDLPRYFGDWRKEGEELGFIVVVPWFSKEDFPGSASYNLGAVFDPETGEIRPREQWTYSAIEPLFDAVVEKVGGKQTQYTLFGHSAGSQFLHRFLYFIPEARVKRAIAANAGWYTMPDFGVDWPYGLDESGVSPDVLPGYFGRDLVVLLGDADVDREDEDLRKTPEAELQGPYRYARGHTFFRVAKARAAQLGVDFGWRLQEVPGAEHSNAQMTPAAARLVD